MQTSEAVAYLGRVLLELGYIGEDELNSSLADLAREKKMGPMLHGQLLVASGALDAPKAERWAPRAGLAQAPLSGRVAG